MFATLFLLVNFGYVKLQGLLLDGSLWFYLYGRQGEGDILCTFIVKISPSFSSRFLGFLHVSLKPVGIVGFDINCVIANFLMGCHLLSHVKLSSML